jgi:hypothetical protein
MRIILVLILIASNHIAFSQTGPGGVGSKATTLKLWFDGKDVNATGIVSGTNPAAGTNLATWNDKSGYGVNVTQNIANVAAISPSGLGVTFNNTGYLLGSDATLPSGGSARTAFVCAASPSTCCDDVMLFYGTANNSQSYGILKKGNGGVRNFFYNNDLDDVGGWLPANQMKIVNTWYKASSQQIYVNGNLSISAVSTPNTLLGQGLQIGGWNSFSLNSNATISEIILHSYALNPAEKAVVENYLSEKYSVVLSSTDYYSGHTGLYINEVQGIGTSDGTVANSQTYSASSGGLEIKTANGTFNTANKYVFTGYSQVSNSISIANLGTVPTVQQRWNRVWYLDKTGTVDITMSFNFATSGISGFATPAGTNYVLLYSSTDPYAFQNLTASNGIIPTVAGSIVSFTITNASLANGYYTIGTTNTSISPLPIELLNFSVSEEKQNVLLSWQTLSEKNNNYFTIQRSSDLITWNDISDIKAAGNSNSLINYSFKDRNPLKGISYYRLKQSDLDGKSTYSAMASVSLVNNGTIAIYPNPTENELTLEGYNVENVNFRLIDNLGQEMPVKFSAQPGKTMIDLTEIPGGIYNLLVETIDKRYLSKKIIVTKK